MEWIYLLDVSKISDKSVDEYKGKKKYSATGDIDYNKIINFEEVYYKDKPSRANRKVSNGEILFAKMKGTAKVLKITKDISNEYIFSTGFTTLKNKKDLNGDYLYYFLISEYFQKEKDKYCSGATQKAINNTNLKKIKIPVPSLEIQEKIVNVLDQAQELIDKRKEQIDLLDQLIESIFYTMFGDPVRNEKGWKIKKLENISAKIGSGSTPRGGEASYKTEGITLIRSMNIYDNKFKYDGLAYIDEEQAKTLSNVIIEDNDILINITGASITRTAIVPKNILPARVNQHVSIIRCNNKLNHRYLLHLLLSKTYKRKIYHTSTSGGATREALTKKDLENFEIPIPPIQLQNEFAQKVETIEKQKEILKESLELLEENYKSIMDKAFKGQLFN